MNDPYKSGHSEKVSQLSELIALKMDLTEEERSLLVIGALLHDIGKLLLPADLWCIPQKIDQDEKKMVKKHSLIGAHLLKQSGFELQIVRIVKYHHESWDGSGYPEQLSGEEIPLMARIVGLSEAYISMISYDIYSGKMEKQEAVNQIQSLRGKQFAPQIVDVFQEVVQGIEV